MRRQRLAAAGSDPSRDHLAVRADRSDDVAVSLEQPRNTQVLRRTPPNGERLCSSAKCCVVARDRTRTNRDAIPGRGRGKWAPANTIRCRCFDFSPPASRTARNSPSSSRACRPGCRSTLARDIDPDLRRRQGGHGRGKRQQIEHDAARIVSGVRGGKTLGSPVTLVIENRDWENWKGPMQVEARGFKSKRVTRVRPGHADLAGVLKYGFMTRATSSSVRARERPPRGLRPARWARTLLAAIGVDVHSCVVRIGDISVSVPDGDASWDAVERSPVRCADETRIGAHGRGHRRRARTRRHAGWYRVRGRLACSGRTWQLRALGPAARRAHRPGDVQHPVRQGCGARRRGARGAIAGVGGA